MKQLQKGFTLIELIVVIVILGILAATALPKFVDFSSNAASAGAAGVAGGLASASAINYGATKASLSATPTTIVGVACTATGANSMWAMLTGGQPSNYTMTGGTCGAAGTTTTCNVVYQSGNTSGTSPSVITCY